jgi:hypothetical protein
MSIAGPIRRTTVETNIDSRSKERNVSEERILLDGLVMRKREGGNVGRGYCSASFSFRLTKKAFVLETMKDADYLLSGVHAHLDQVADSPGSIEHLDAVCRRLEADFQEAE